MIMGYLCIYLCNLVCFVLRSLAHSVIHVALWSVHWAWRFYLLSCCWKCSIDVSNGLVMSETHSVVKMTLSPHFSPSLSLLFSSLFSLSHFLFLSLSVSFHSPNESQNSPNRSLSRDEKGYMLSCLNSLFIAENIGLA